MGLSQSEAYRRAGYSCKPEHAGAHASALCIRNHKIRERKNEIAMEFHQAEIEAAKGIAIDKCELIKSNFDIRRKALQKNDMMAALSANRELARIGGLYKSIEGHSGNIHYQRRRLNRDHDNEE